MRAKARPTVDLPTPDRLTLLKRSIVFRGLEDAQLEVLAQLGRWMPLAEGEVLCRENDPGTEMYAIGIGTVELQKEATDGPRFIAQREVGEVVGEMALLDNRPRSATAICATDCMFLAIRKTEFIACLRRNPQLAMGIIANLVGRLREADERAIAEAGADVMVRLAKFLLDEAKLDGGVGRIKPKPADRKIAERIGCTRETVNRKLTELQAKGILNRRRSELTILDEDELSAIADGV